MIEYIRHWWRTRNLRVFVCSATRHAGGTRGHGIPAVVIYAQDGRQAEAAYRHDLERHPYLSQFEWHVLISETTRRAARALRVPTSIASATGGRQ